MSKDMFTAYIVLHRNAFNSVTTNKGIKYAISIRPNGGYEVFGTRAEAYRECASSDVVFEMVGRVTEALERKPNEKRLPRDEKSVKKVKRNRTFSKNTKLIKLK